MIKSYLIRYFFSQFKSTRKLMVKKKWVTDWKINFLNRKKIVTVIAITLVFVIANKQFPLKNKLSKEKKTKASVKL